MKFYNLNHTFVKFMPETIKEGILFISLEYNIAIHKCPCGCGNKIVTPISPKDWKLTYDGDSITLYPSIGNWSLPCKTHYWISNSKIIVARTFSRREIDKVRKQEEPKGFRRFGKRKPQ